MRTWLHDLMHDHFTVIDDELGKVMQVCAKKYGDRTMDCLLYTLERDDTVTMRHYPNLTRNDMLHLVHDL